MHTQFDIYIHFVCLSIFIVFVFFIFLLNIVYFFLFIDGELNYLRHKGTKQQIKVKVVCGAEQANTIFEEFHASSLGAHTGPKKTRNMHECRGSFLIALKLKIMLLY